MSGKINFLDPKLSLDSLDIFWVKKSILRAVVSELPNFEGILLDVGCGQQPYRKLITNAPSRVSKYIGLDLAGQTYSGAEDILPDLRWDGVRIPLGAASVDTVFATEVLEHCPDPEAVLSEIWRVLKPGGGFFFTVPFLWPLHDVPYDYYRYTPFALEHLCCKTGFKEIQLNPLGGWDASLGQMLGLWVRRRPISNKLYQKLFRKVLSILIRPIQSCLYARDFTSVSFGGSPMITGLRGWVIK